VEVAEQLVADRSEQRCPHKQRPSEDLIRCARRHGVAEPSKVGVDGSWYGQGRRRVDLACRHAIGHDLESDEADARRRGFGRGAVAGTGLP